MKKTPKINPPQVRENGTDNPPDYPLYPESEDIYSRYRKEDDTDPEDITRIKKSDVIDRKPADSEDESDYVAPGSDLDVPDFEFDDEGIGIGIGIEDEENSYYSLGGDDHNDLDEDKNEL